MTNQRCDQLPSTLRRREIRSDNLVLVPGNALLDIEYWQAIANNLPHGDVLVVLPRQPGRLHATLSRVIPLIEGHGHHVTTLGSGDFL